MPSDLPPRSSTDADTSPVANEARAPMPADEAAPFAPMPMPDGAWRYAAPASGPVLSPAWRVALAIGWLAVMAAVAAFANSGFLVSSSPFWLDIPGLQVLPFLVPVAAVLALLRDWRFALLVSLAGAVGLAVVGGLDVAIGSAPVGKGELVLAANAALLTLAGLAGRLPRPST